MLVFSHIPAESSRSAPQVLALVDGSQLCSAAGIPGMAGIPVVAFSREDLQICSNATESQEHSLLHALKLSAARQCHQHSPHFGWHPFFVDLGVAAKIAILLHCSGRPPMPKLKQRLLSSCVASLGSGESRYCTASDWTEQRHPLLLKVLLSLGNGRKRQLTVARL